METPGGWAPSCDEVQWELCRLAVGVRLGSRALPVARHVRGCTECDAFVDELADMRNWLQTMRHPGERDEDEADLERRARAALVRELEARLARDLLALGQGGRLRPEPVRSRDVERARALRSDSSVPEDVFEAATSAVLGASRTERHAALGLAARLDPSGLDVALAWLGLLVRMGEGERAHVVADRLLARVP